MSASPRMDGDRRAVSIIPHWTHITDSTGFPLCCYEKQPAPLTAGENCPLCWMIAALFPDTVTVRHPHDEEVLPFTDDPATCAKCGGELAVLQITKHRRGNVVLKVTDEIIVCPRCKGLS